MNKKKKHFSIVIGAIIGCFLLWYFLIYILPVYHFESSDRGMAEMEVPWKGRDFGLVKKQFEEYKKWKADPNLKLCRTSKRIWYAPNLWWENLTHQRWDLPYVEPSKEPHRDYFLKISDKNTQINS